MFENTRTKKKHQILVKYAFLPYQRCTCTNSVLCSDGKNTIKGSHEYFPQNNHFDASAKCSTSSSAVPLKLKPRKIPGIWFKRHVYIVRKYTALGKLLVHSKYVGMLARHSTRFKEWPVLRNLKFPNVPASPRFGKLSF